MSLLPRRGMCFSCGHDWGDGTMQVDPFAQSLLSENAALRHEVEELRETNRKLNRRAQQIEAPREQCKALIRQANNHWGDTWVHEFNRLIGAHTEIKGMFLELARAYEYPQDGKHLHSCMDSNVEFPREKHDGVWANCFLTHQGGMKSIRVLNEVKRAVNELLELRRK